MRYLEAEEIIAINKRVIAAGERYAVISRGGLESAVGRHKGFENVYQSAAALIESLLVNHPFEQGNKRTAFIAGAHILESERLRFTMNQIKLAGRFERMVTERWGRQKIAQWLKRHTS
jgi:death-on-curing protein